MNIANEESTSVNDPTTTAEQNIDSSEILSPINKNQKERVRILKLFYMY